ncbi:hypothetical protein IAR55_004930 [Kwoniella newhampshirensis]|uniref:Uncharacterized protein n=1 Tax=Kwoniella newhampshirensis TaxID=1651941 RepID=A0AAW0YIG9_9TREE
MSAHSTAQGLFFSPPRESAYKAQDSTEQGMYPQVWGWGYDRPKRGFWDKVTGGGPSVEWDDSYGYVDRRRYSPPQRYRPPRQTTPIYGKPIPQLSDPAIDDPTTPLPLPPLVPHRVKPLPSNFQYLDGSTRRKLLREQEKEAKMWEKMNKEQMKLLEKSMKIKEKEERKKRKEEERARKNVRAKEKQILWKLRHPQNLLPQLSPDEAFRPTRKPSENATPKPATQLQSQAEAAGEPMSFMLLPTLEEMGVRRPFDAPGLPAALGGAGTWPMMSRTMSHALVDMTREERVHSIQRGILQK